MNSKTLEALIELVCLMADEVETEEHTTEEVMEELVASDLQVQEAVLAYAKRVYEILKDHIDADRLGELVVESGLDPDFFDQRLAKS